MAGLVEIPAIAMAIFIIFFAGKKWILFSTMFCAGIACMCIAIIDAVDEKGNIQWLKITFLMLGKLRIYSTLHTINNQIIEFV